MMCLSIRQPFADLIVLGMKRVEFRNWNTEFRGEFLVHASKTMDKKTSEKNLVTGAIIGKVTLYSVRRYKNKKYHYGFLLKHPRRFKEPIPMAGKLHFFDVAWP
jgi:predicted transcriptional regulator